MKLNTRYIILSIAAALTMVALGGCPRENIPANSNDILNFSVGFAGSNEIALTKGTQINSESEFLDAELTSFTAQGWNADKSPFIPSETVNCNDGLWKTTKVYRWANSEIKTFLASANVSTSGVASVTNYVTPSVKQTFSYTVPADARQQNDIMLGYYEGNGKGTATAAITMVHPLTAVVFKKGAMDDSINAIRSISIEGVFVSGTADVTYINGSTVVPSYDWTSRTGSQTVTLGPAENATELETNAEGKIGVPFIILPQDISANALKLKIAVVKNGEDVVLSTTLPAGKWEEGKTNVFSISISAVHWLEISYVSPWSSETTL